MTERLHTLTLAEAAALLKMHPQTLRRLAKLGVIPAAKPGRRWCFLETDLARYLRALYAAPRQVPQGAMTEDSLWHSTSAATRGGSASRPQTAERYAALIGLETSETRRSSTIGSRGRRGGRTSSPSSRGGGGRKQSSAG